MAGMLSIDMFENKDSKFKEVQLTEKVIENSKSLLFDF